MDNSSLKILCLMEIIKFNSSHCQLIQKLEKNYLKSFIKNHQKVIKDVSRETGPLGYNTNDLTNYQKLIV